MEANDETFIRQAIEVARAGMDRGDGGPFGCVIVRNGQVVATGNNRVLADNDPTAHAEVVAIRAACQALGSFQLTDCVLYTSCEPCPMCLGAIYWARPARIVYAADREDAAAGGFDDSFIYNELPLAPQQRRIPTGQLLRSAATPLFAAWQARTERTPY